MQGPHVLEGSYDIFSMSFRLFRKQSIRRINAQITFINCEKEFREGIEASFWKKAMKPISSKDRVMMKRTFVKELKLLKKRNTVL